MRITIITVAMSLALSGCYSSQESAKSEVANEAGLPTSQPVSNLLIDIKSPDNAVKSMWAALNERDIFQEKICNEYSALEKKLQESAIENVRKIAIGPMLESYSNPPARDCETHQYDKEIIEVKTESETRAVVFAKIKNVTPIPAGMSLAEDEIESRHNGSKYRYVLEKDAEGWKLVQAFTYNKYRETLGGEEWNAIYKANEVKSSFAYSFVYME